MINTCKNNARQHYVPLAKLTYATRLKQMLKQELGFQGKPKVLDLLVNEIEMITRDCYVNKEQIGIGQIKKFLTGKGNAKKNLMLMNVYKKYGIECSDDNQADAFTGAKLLKNIYEVENKTKIKEDFTKYEWEVINGINN